MRVRSNVPRRRGDTRVTPPVARRALGVAVAVAMAPAAVAASTGAPDDGTRSPTAWIGDGTHQRPADTGWTLDLSPGGDVDAATLDARGAGLPGVPGSGRLVAHEVLAGLLAWEAGRGLGDGAHVRPVVATVRAEAFAAADGGDAPMLGAATGIGGTAGGTIEGIERYRHDGLDLALDGPPVLPADVVVDELPGLRFERRTLYQASTGRLFVDFRLRHRDPAHGMDALDDEARTAAAIARMRTLSTFVLEPVTVPPPAR